MNTKIIMAVLLGLCSVQGYVAAMSGVRSVDEYITQTLASEKEKSEAAQRQLEIISEKFNAVLARIDLLEQEKGGALEEQVAALHAQIAQKDQEIADMDAEQAGAIDSLQDQCRLAIEFVQKELEAVKSVNGNSAAKFKEYEKQISEEKQKNVELRDKLVAQELAHSTALLELNKKLDVASSGNIESAKEALDKALEVVIVDLKVSLESIRKDADEIKSDINESLDNAQLNLKEYLSQIEANGEKSALITLGKVLAGHGDSIESLIKELRPLYTEAVVLLPKMPPVLHSLCQETMRSIKNDQEQAQSKLKEYRSQLAELIKRVERMSSPTVKKPSVEAGKELHQESGKPLAKSVEVVQMRRPSLPLSSDLLQSAEPLFFELQSPEQKAPLKDAVVLESSPAVSKPSNVIKPQENTSSVKLSSQAQSKVRLLEKSLDALVQSYHAKSHGLAKDTVKDLIALLEKEVKDAQQSSANKLLIQKEIVYYKNIQKLLETLDGSKKAKLVLPQR